MSRDITLLATWADLAGDETYELWLKHESEAWILQEVGDVTSDENNQQEFLIPTLVADDSYVAQIRLTRAGRYRAGYLTTDPDTWPEDSRCEFIPGALAGVGAPTILSAVWERTGFSATNITLSITADDLDKDLKVYRDGALVGTISAPHVNPVAFVDNDPDIAESHSYTARHTAGTLNGPLSAPVLCFAGPLPPEDFELVSAIDHYGSYTVQWDAGGDVVRLEDDFLCAAIFSAAIGGGGTTTDSSYEVVKEITELPEGAFHTENFVARIRRELDSFAVTDVSDWVEAPISMAIDDDNAEFHSCP